MWTSALAAPDPRTRVQFIATGGGDAIFIRTANGARVLIDGSAEPTALLAHLGNQMTLWDRRLDLVVATHGDEQNLASLNAVLERYAVGQVLEPPAPARGGVSYKRWRELIGQGGFAVVEPRAGTQLKLDEVTVNVLSPGAEQPDSDVALRVVAGSQTLFIAPALSSSDLDRLLATDADLSADVAVLPRAFGETLLKRVQPRYVVLFVGRSSREQPDPDALKRLAGTPLLRTDERGTVEFIVDKDELVLRAER